MEVILLKDMEKLGYANDIVNVKPGYANNYLIPQGYAKAATASAKKVLAENLKQRAHKDAKILADAQALAEKIANLPLTIAMKAEEGKIFGSVTAADLAEALAAKGVELDRKTITVEAIKNVGEYEASAKLHREVKATIKFIQLLLNPGIFLRWVRRRLQRVVRFSSQPCRFALSRTASCLFWILGIPERYGRDFFNQRLR